MPRSMRPGRSPLLAAFCALPLLAVPLHAQVFTVEAEHVEKHYTEFPPTHVRYPADPITTLGREELVRFMQAEQGFAMRPLPIANLTLHANGHMDPTGDKYVDELHQKGVSVKPGDRVVVTDIRIREKTIELDLNGGPEHKHKYLRHISIGTGAAEVPLAQDSGAPPTGARLTLLFEERVPDLNGEQLEALLKPMVDFGVKSPAEAFAESLPDFLRKAVEEHRVLVGMDRDMVVYSKGQPNRKVRETSPDGKAFEIWIYGEAPQPVEFVRFEGSFVTRVELAKVGEPMQERTENEMGDYWGNQPVVANNQHEVKLGDATEADRSEENAPRSAPTLRKPGEELPADHTNPAGAMQPVNMPPDQRRPGDPGYTPTVSAKPCSGQGQASSQGSTQTGSTQTGSTQNSGQASGSGSASSSTPCPQPQSGTAGSSQPQSGSANSQQKSSSNSTQQPQSGSSQDQPNPLDKPQ
ncbi:MAG: hypothetical protein WBX06_15130 [Acidobacteriaceae bacterium]